MDLANSHDLSCILFQCIRGELQRHQSCEPFEVEFKFGLVCRKTTNARIHFPASNPVVLCDIDHDVYFKSEIAQAHHKASNRRLNDLFLSMKQSGCDIHYEHLKIRDQFFVDGLGRKVRKSLHAGGHSERDACIHKRRVRDFHVHYPGSPYDIRLSISVEHPVQAHLAPDVPASFERAKDRITYKFPAGFSLDLTQVTSSASQTHELELELDVSKLCIECVTECLSMIDFVQNALGTI